MDDLPPEVLAHIIACLRPPDPALLRLRAVCKKWWKAVPFGDLVGIKKETAEWLLGGKVVEWDEQKMNSPSFTVLNHWHPFMVALSNTCYYRQFNDHTVDVGSIRYGIDYFSGGLVVWKTDSAADGRPEIISTHMFPFGERFLACCQWCSTFFILTRAGRLFKLKPTESIDETVELFNAIDNSEHKQLQPQFVESIQSLMFFFSTCDGKNFWLHNSSADLLLMEEGRNDVQVMAKEVDNAQIIDSSIVYQTREEIKILHWKSTVFSTHTGIKNIFQFCVMPSLKCVWLNTRDGRTLRKGAPFLLSAEVCTEKTTFVQLLRDKLRFPLRMD